MSKGYYKYEVNGPGPLDKNIQTIIIRSETYIVYIDEDDVIQYSVDEDKHDARLLGEIQNLVSHWETLVDRLFSRRDSLNYKGLLAEAYARVFDGSTPEQAHAVLHRTSEQIEKNGREILKQAYLVSSFWMTLLVVGLGLAIAYLYDQFPQWWNKPAYEILEVSLCGGIGAFVFATLRLRSYTPDVCASKRTHQLDGRLRVFYGIVAAFMLCLGLRSNVVLGFVNEANAGLALEAFLGIVAGASEALVPNIIKQVDSRTGG